PLLRVGGRSGVSPLSCSWSGEHTGDQDKAGATPRAAQVPHRSACQVTPSRSCTSWLRVMPPSQASGTIALYCNKERQVSQGDPWGEIVEEALECLPVRLSGRAVQRAREHAPTPWKTRV